MRQLASSPADRLRPRRRRLVGVLDPVRVGLLDDRDRVVTAAARRARRPAAALDAADRGNVYVNSIGFDFAGGEFAPGIVALVTPDGAARQVADGFALDTPADRLRALVDWAQQHSPVAAVVHCPLEVTVEIIG
jgi:hypothetical protein